MKDEVRNEKYKKNLQLEEYIKVLNEILSSGSENFFKNYSNYTEPEPVFIVGSPRSGTTLLTQLLSATNEFAYPSNLVSRFYLNPHIGFMIHRLISDPELNYKKEMNFIASLDNFGSDIGKTEGLLSPNEFWYFWRRFFPINGELPFRMESCDKNDLLRLKKEMSFIFSLKKKPVLFKGLCFNWNLKDIEALFPKARFIFIQRNLKSNAFSILNTRKQFFNDETQWYSFKGPEFEKLKSRSPVEQAIGQVLLTNKNILSQSKLLNGEVISVNYDELCINPDEVLTDLLLKLKIDYKNSFNGKLKHSNEKSIPESIAVELEKASDFVKGLL